MLLVLAALALAAPRPPVLRLEDGQPLSYRAELWVDPAAPTFRGEIDIEVDLEGKRELLWLNGVDIEVTGATVTATGTAVPAEIVEGDEQTFGVAWDGALDGIVTVHLAWQGKVQDDASYGLFHQSEGGADYLFTQFESIDARRVFPCFDQPEFKTPWTLTLYVPATVGAWSNAPMAIDAVHAGARMVVFEPTEPLPTYLLAFVVGPFETVDVGTAGREHTPIRILVPPGRAPDAAWAAEILPRVLEYEEEWFDRPYPYAKLDIVAVPSTLGYGGMEHAGLITINQGVVLARSVDDDSLGRRQYWAEVIAHELGHQWFGNLVTMAWWDDLWLSESFASWLSSNVLAALWPEWQPEAGRMAVRAQALSADSLPSVRRIREPIRELGDIDGAFDSITYQKGESVLAAVEAWIGPDAFQRGIRRYLADHAWGSATVDDLAAALAAETPEDVAAVIHGYVDQPGAPLVTFDLVCDDAPRLLMRQERYVLTGSPGGARWDIPLCVRTPGPDGDVRTCARLAARTGEIPLPSCPAWVVPNDLARGYYQSRMPAPLMQGLLVDADLTLAEQIGFLGDASALVNTGDLEPSLLLDRVPEFVALDEDAVTAETIQVVAALDDNLVPEELRPAYQRFVEQTFGPAARRLGFDAVRGEDTTTTNLRPQVLGMVGHKGEDLVVRTEAIKRVEKWLVTREGIEEELLPVMLDLAGHFGEPALVARLREAALAEGDRDLRGMLLGASVSVRDPETLRTTLDLALGKDLDLQDTAVLISRPMGHSDQRPIAWAWYVEHLDEIETKVPGPFRFYLVYMGGAWCDEEHRREVEELFAPRAKRWIGGRRALQTTLEGIDACEASVARQQEGVRAFLEDW